MAVTVNTADALPLKPALSVKVHLSNPPTVIPVHEGVPVIPETGVTAVGVTPAGIWSQTVTVVPEVPSPDCVSVKV